MRHTREVILTIGLAALVAATTAQAQTGIVYREKFDNFVSDNHFNSEWPMVNNVAFLGGLDTTDPHSAPNSLKHPGGAQRYHRFAGAGQELIPTDANPVLFKYWYYDDMVATRTTGTIFSGVPKATGTAWCELGLWNTTSGRYFFRPVALGYGGDLWIVIDGVSRSKGWHEMRLEIGGTFIRAKVDASPWKTVTVTMPAGRAFNHIGFGGGSGVSSAGGAKMDDVHISYLSDEAYCAVCSDVPSLSISGVLDDGQTTVNVTPVSPLATRVNVYANGTLIGFSEAAPFAATVAVTIDTDPATPGNQGLVDGTEIKATQVMTVSLPSPCTPQVVESCLPWAGVVVGSCQQVPQTQIGNVLAAGMTTVKVKDISASAVAVTVYGNLPAAWSQTLTVAGETTVDVTVPALVNGDSVSATQTIGLVEGCKPGPAKEVGNCNQVSHASLGSLVGEGQTAVIVTNIDPTASLVTVYNATGSLGSANPAGATWASVPVTALVLGNVLHATQTVNGIESCSNGPTRTVGAAGIVEDFNGTVAVVQSGATPSAYRTWYDASEGNNTDVRSTGVRTTMPGTNSKCINIWDHGWTNGAYAIFEKVIPATGQYHLEVDMLIDEPDGGDYDFYSTYEVGVVPAGVHRSASGALTAIKDVTGFYPCLTRQRDGLDLVPVKVKVKTFNANAGDDLLIAFSTSVGTWDRGKAANPISGTTWPGMLIDNIRLVAGPRPPHCSDVPVAEVYPTSTNPLAAGKTKVTVKQIDPDASIVRVLANSTEIGSIVPNGAPEVTVDVTALVAGESIVAVQTVDGMESCQCPGATGLVVGRGINTAIKVALGIRETGCTSGCTIGADGGNGGAIEWVGASAKGAGGEPVGKLLSTSPDWQDLTFRWAPMTSPDPVTGFAGACDGTVNGTWGTLESLNFTIDDLGNTGPYILYVDSIYNGTTLLTDFESYAVGDQVLFRRPSVSGSTPTNVLSDPQYPDISEVTTEEADGGTKSCKIGLQFVDGLAKRWVRVTSDDSTLTTDIPLQNALIDLTQPITMRVKFFGPPNCGPVFADFDGDKDVDMVDYAAFQRCLTIDSTIIPPECLCFDHPFNNVIGADDLTAFHNCASGPGVEATAGCGN